MARIAGINIPINKHIVIALTSIHGIGRARAEQICVQAGVTPQTHVKDLAESEVAGLREAVAQFIVEGDLRRETAMNIKRLFLEGKEQKQMQGPVKVLDEASRDKKKNI